MLSLRIVLSECNGQRGAEGAELSVVYREQREATDSEGPKAPS